MSDTTIAITKREAASTRANQRLRKQGVDEADHLRHRCSR